MNQNLPEGGPILPEDTDILCGKSRSCVNHIGSRRYRHYLETYRGRYASATTKHQKMQLIKEIHNNLSPTCRFLAFNKRNSEWEELSASKARDKIGHALRHVNASRDEPTAESETNPDTRSSFLNPVNVANQVAAQSIPPYAALPHGATPRPIAGAMQGIETNASSLSMGFGDVKKPSAAKQWSSGVASQGSSLPRLPFGTELGANGPQIPDARAVLTQPLLNLAIQQHHAALLPATVHPSQVPGGGNHLHGLGLLPHVAADTRGSVSNPSEAGAMTTADRSTIPLYHPQGRLRPNVHPSPISQHMRPLPSHAPAKEAKTLSPSDWMSTASTTTTLRPLQYPQARLSTGLPEPRQFPASIHSGRSTNSTQAIGASSFVESNSSSSAASISSAPTRGIVPLESFQNPRAHSVTVGASAMSSGVTVAAASSAEEQQQKQNDVAGSDLEGIMKEPIQEWGETTDTPSPQDVLTRSFSSSPGQSRGGK